MVFLYLAACLVLLISLWNFFPIIFTILVVVPATTAFLIFLLGACALWVYQAKPRPPALVQKFHEDWVGKTTGHRGLGIPGLHVPENSLPAFMGAKELGADAVECDIMLTADDSVAVFHDVSLHRCLEGLGYAPDKTIAELEKLDYRYPPMSVAESARLNECLRLNPPLEGEDLESYLQRTAISLPLEEPHRPAESPAKEIDVSEDSIPSTSEGFSNPEKPSVISEGKSKKLHRHTQAILEGKGTLLLAEILTGASFEWDPENPLGPDLSELSTVESADGEDLVCIPDPPEGTAGALSPRSVMDLAAQATTAAVTATLDDHRFDFNHDHNNPKYALSRLGHETKQSESPSEVADGPSGFRDEAKSLSLPSSDSVSQPENPVKHHPSYGSFEKLAAKKAAELCEASISVEQHHLKRLGETAATSRRLREIRFQLPSDILEDWTRVPKLLRMLRLCWRLDLRVIIEIKEIFQVRKMVACLQKVLDEWESECLAESGASLETTPPESRPSVTHVLIASFDPRSLYLFRKARPLVPLCLLYCAALGDWIMSDNSEGVKVPQILRKFRFLITVADWILEYGAPYLVAPFLQADMVSAHSVLISPQLVAFNKRHGRVTGAWTVNNYLDRDYLQSLGVCVTTDRCFYPRDILAPPQDQ